MERGEGPAALDLILTPEVILREGARPVSLLSQLSGRFASDSRIGGIATFAGIVRADEIDGRRVRAIEFSAYREMAEPALRELVSRVAAESLARREGEGGPVRVHLEHALGEVAVGEAPVVIVVGTGHREEAFSICRGILEALKKEIPIYGKELFDEDGYRWKENR